MIRMLTPPTMPAPPANYSHVAEVPAGTRLVFLSGQLGVRLDGSIPEGAGEQTAQCFENIKAGLEAVGLGLENIIRLNAMVTDREHLGAYMKTRDRYVASPPPASTLIIVSGFARPEFKVEIEVVAAGPDTE